jgi:hypothetical protein
VPLISFPASISLPEANPNSAEQSEDLRMVSNLTSEDFVLSSQWIWFAEPSLG